MAFFSPDAALSRARPQARLALFCLLGAVVVLLTVGGSGGLLVLFVGVAGVAVMAAGTWWVIAHHGAVRVVGGLLALGGPAAVIVLYARADLLPAALGALVLLAAAAASARAAARSLDRPAGMQAVACAAPRHAVLIMNPKSGGGKVARFRLAEKAREMGAEVVLLDTSGHSDVTQIARAAVAQGADLLGVAGGDGTQALVAQVAAENSLPFLVISAGTRNHFAMDLGLDREDPAACLDGLTDGEELNVDLGAVDGRPFVNTVSFGVYADVVQRPEYRDSKAGTALDALPGLLLAYAGEPLEARVGDVRLDAQQALLVSNNPYSVPGLAAGTGGRRPRLDGGRLGVVGVRVTSAAQAAGVALRGPASVGLKVMDAGQVTVTAQAPSIAVGVDGEALSLPTPVTCTISPRALRVRVPRKRPGSGGSGQALSWRTIFSLAFGRRRQTEILQG
ncbi:diacylglycerol kinase family protein [Streptacidiphilus sp. P02-A3a]|uniref:diacylglycerol/lipid kinase family protein n=1 Tax=Streptacidiphilus sp. P02-A3a TaxID=2704468 RepID=UPI0015FD9C80|nr:diacylglycerol kinase family protein [Streptacidiphilus sp. P02-A3a]QMU69136.1 diacylglycerol kinase [Streptacidiphilus sp. P02-A3a]